MNEDEIRHYLNEDEEPARLDETTYKDIMRFVTKNNLPGAIDHNLPHRDWAPLIPYVNYVGRKNDIFEYFVPNKYNGWNVQIEFMEFYQVVGDTDLSVVEASRLLLWVGNIKLHCECPAFLWWSPQYMLSTMDAAIHPINIPPTIRNPNRIKCVCKHCNRVLKVMPFHLGDLASAIKEERNRRR